MDGNVRDMRLSGNQKGGLSWLPALVEDLSSQAGQRNAVRGGELDGFGMVQLEHSRSNFVMGDCVLYLAYFFPKSPELWKGLLPEFLLDSRADIN